MKKGKVTHIIVNNLGGITSLAKNLIHFKADDDLEQELIILNIVGNNNAAAGLSDVTSCPKRYFTLDKMANWYHTYKELASFIGEDPGVIVSNDVYDLIMATRFNVNKKIVQIVHDEYNLKLSLEYKQCIDAFICHSKFIYEQLRNFVPERKQDIYLRYYGIQLAEVNRKCRFQDQPLRLMFLGRHDKAKGVYDLFEINSILKKKDVPVTWTILGAGPETDRLKKQWINETNVRFRTPEGSDLYKEIQDQDVFVFPTKFEGYPVALVETMSLGCVPVVTNLEGGIQELVNSQTGHKCEMDNNQAFAEAILKLHLNRVELEAKSLASFLLSRNRHNAKVQSKEYQQLFTDIASTTSIPRHHRQTKDIGSRLDKSWIPNFVTRTIRKAIRG